MEQKKTLWIVAATGVFLLVVVGAALILSSTSQRCSASVNNPADGWISGSTISTQAAAQTPVMPVTTQDTGIAPIASANEDVAPLPQTQPETGTAATAPVSDPLLSAASPVKVENVTVITDSALVYGSGTTTTIDLNALKTGTAPASVTPQNPLTAAQMIQTQQAQAPVAKTEYTPAPDSYYAPAPSAPAVKKQVPAKEAEKAPAAPAKKVTKTTKKAASKTTAKPAPKPAVPETYWIQAGSYEVKKSADDARSILEANKIPNEVFTYKDAKGKLFYRVRVGPYTTKSEAEYWQKRISLINEFAKVNSYVVKN